MQPCIRPGWLCTGAALALNVVNKHIYVCRLTSDVALSVNNSHNRFRGTRNFSRNFRFLFFAASKTDGHLK